MYEKKKVLITNDEFDLIDRALNWYSKFYENNKNQDIFALKVVNLFINKMDKYAGLDYLELTDSEYHYIKIALHEVNDETKIEGLEKIIEKLNLQCK